MLVVFGTRPEAIKMCPVVLELKKREGIDVKVAVTGQHRLMLDQVLEAFGVVPDYDLHVMKNRQTLFDITTSVLNGMKAVIEEVQPSVVLVHGDTTTAFATALASFFMMVPVGHVEAGLRTYDIHSPYPEEFNREAVGIISEYNFAPTEAAKRNLLKEGKNPKGIFVTGNTVIDSLKTTVRPDYFHSELEWCGNNRLILITAHRRENLGEPMHRMFRAIRRVLDKYDDVRAIYPIHMNPAVRQAAEDVFGGECFEFDREGRCYDTPQGKNERIHIIEPLNVLDFHNFMARSYLILTDSGGIQEEAPSLGIPVLVMRDTTERPEGVEAGTLKLVGTDEETIYKEFVRLLSDKNEYLRMSQASNPYGDGNASKRIVDIIERASFNSPDESDLLR